MNRYIFCLLLISVFFTGNSYAQLNNKVASTDTSKKTQPTPKKDTLIETGVAVSPSTLRFNVKPGTLQTKTVKITNDTRKKYSFQVGFQDFGPGADGQADIPTDKYAKFALSKYIVVSPTVVEVGPRQSKIVTVTIDIPAGDSMAMSMWTNMDFDQILDREQLEIPNLSKNAVGMGVKNTFGFVVHIYQNPPNVVTTNVEIAKLMFNRKTDKSPPSIAMEAFNAGNGIGYCLFYVEITNLVTGKQSKMKVKQFPIFPGYRKNFNVQLPKDIEKGPYSALAVLDFGNKDELQTAELEFTVE
jgi:hypothetical protein